MRFPPLKAICKSLFTAARLPGLLLAALILTLSAGQAAAQDQAKKRGLPVEAAVIPQDAFAFVHLRPAELWQSDPGVKIRKLFPLEIGDFLKAIGEDPAETESFTMVFPTANSAGFVVPEIADDANGEVSMLFVETTVKPLDRARVLERVLGKGAVEHKHNKRIYYISKTPQVFLSGAVHFVDDRTYLFAFSAEMMEKTLAGLDRPRTEGPLSSALELVAQKRHVVLGLNAGQATGANMRRELADRLFSPFFGGPGGMVPLWALQPLLEVRSAAVAIDVGADLRIDADLAFPTVRDAVKGAGAVEDLSTVLRIFLKSMGGNRREMLNNGRDFRNGPGEVDQTQLFAELLLTQLERTLHHAKIDQNQTALKVRGQHKIDVDSLRKSINRGSSREDFALIHVRVADIWRSDLIVKLRKLFPEVEQESPLRLLAEMSLDLDNVESATFVLPTSSNFFFGGGGAPKEKFKEEKKDAFPPPVEPEKKLDKGKDLDKEFKDLGLEDLFDKAKDRKEINKEKDRKEKFDKEKSDKERELKELLEKERLDKERQLRELIEKERQIKELMERENQLKKFEMQQRTMDEDSMLEQANMVLVTTVKPYDRAKLMKGMLQGFPMGKTVEKKHRDKTYVTVDRPFGVAVHFVDERTFLLVQPAEFMPRALDRQTLFQASKTLAGAVESAKKKHPLVIALNFNEASVVRGKRMLMDELRRPFREELELFESMMPLLETQSALLVADLGKEVRIQADLHFETPQQAARGTEAVKDGLTLARLYILSRARAEIRFSVQDILENDDAGPLVFGETVLVPGDRPVLVAQRDLRPLFFADGLIAQAETMLRKTAVDKDEATLRVLAQTRVDVAALEAQAKEDAVALVKSQESEIQRRKSARNLEKMVQAIHAYHEVHRKLPVSDKLSWRVHILPFMDELALYQEFKLNEAWDSPHNIKLLPRMPKFYAPPGTKTAEPFTTHYLGVTGPGTFFDPNLKWKGIPDGAAIVESAAAVAWTRPTDLVYDAKNPLPKLGLTPHGFHVAFGRGEVRFVSPPVREANLRSIFMATKPNRDIPNSGIEIPK